MPALLLDLQGMHSMRSLRKILLSHDDMLTASLSHAS